MAISISFLIKHIRPIGTGFEAYCSADLIAYLHDVLDFSFDDIIGIFAQWRQTAQADPHGESNLFITAAKEVAFARWAELYPTSSSTLMFLDSDQLASLSLAGQTAGPNAQFDWNYGDDLAICVSINHDTGAHHIRWNAVGCTVATDGNGNINHFVGLI
jgi:hypothetical protein